MTLLKDVAKKVCEKEFLDTWFKWVGYALIVATLIAAGKQAGSYWLQGVGYASGLAMGLHIISQYVGFTEGYKHDDKNASVNAISVFIILIVIVAIFSSIFPVIKSLIHHCVLQ